MAKVHIVFFLRKAVNWAHGHRGVGQVNLSNFEKNCIQMELEYVVVIVVGIHDHLLTFLRV